MNDDIINKGFKLYSVKSQYNMIQGVETIKEYLALAYSENTNTIEKPIKFIYNETTTEYKITTYNNNDKIYDEFFSMGKVTKKDELINIIDQLPFLVKEINLEDLYKYE
jgi:hypothetical protein